ncbi:hypothetical protein QJS10_CPA16g00609 [Acorus calamus]|uniref:Seipin n=1 Tax=Acorus calamus TaxID=4465 RepID=A0AAV9CYX3_ACOCL|nr:hypothetical protein QJS10_CPA16g00609 [Acorus calamus]
MASQSESIWDFLTSISSTVLSFVTPSNVEPSPSRAARGGGFGALVLRKFGFGILGAVYVGIALFSVMLVSALVGGWIVGFSVEEPVVLRRNLHFDYTEAHPSAVVLFGVGAEPAIPVGQTFHVSVVLVLPESLFNRQMGVFQVTAEGISIGGDIIIKSSQPCMLRYRSLPIRLMQTFVMSIPLLTGVVSETQRITIKVLDYKETSQRTGAIKLRIRPRSGTLDLPHLYGAEMVMHSQLPWKKELVYNWKWTIFVWATLYVYITLLILLVFCFKQLFFGTVVGSSHKDDALYSGRIQILDSLERDQRFTGSEFSDTLRSGRQRSRMTRIKIPIQHEVSQACCGSSSAGDDASEIVECCGDDFVASESSEC